VLGLEVLKRALHAEGKTDGRIGARSVKMREKTKVVYVLRCNWDGNLYAGPIGKLPMTFDSKEEAEEYPLTRCFGSPYTIALYAATRGGE
jgi:hypothetical protein